MSRSVIGLLLMVLFIFLLVGCGSNELMAQEHPSFKKEVYERFNEEMPFFIPNVNESTSYEFVYESEDNDGFYFDLYLDEEQRILTEQEHRGRAHTHGTEDLFYSFFKAKGELEEVDIKNLVASLYGSDTALEDMDRKIINRYTSCYEEGIIEYKRDHYEVYWITDGNRHNGIQGYIEHIEGMLGFLGSEHMSRAFIILSEVDELTNTSLYIPGEDHYIELSFCVSQDGEHTGIKAMTWLLKGIGQKL